MPSLGSQQDRFLTLFKDSLYIDLQQRGSSLGNIFRRENAKGQRAHFDKIGRTTARQKISRHQAITPANENYERRLVTFETIFDAHIMDINDLMDMVSDPTSEVLQNMSFALGRDMDRIIMNAISGSAVVQTNGVTSNVALPNGQKIGASDISYDLDLTAGDKGLTPGKLMKAQKILKQNYANGDFVVIAPAGQLANVLAHARASSGDYVTARPLESAGFEPGLSGYLGMQYIHYEETGVDTNLDEKVFVVARDAVKILVRQDLKTIVENRPDLVGSPVQLQALMDLGASRVFEEAVVEIACDPRK